MSALQEMPPRKSVAAPQPTLPQRLREVLTSPNAIRTASVAVFFVIWEYYGRRMDRSSWRHRARSSTPRCN
jgi:hypothetical protein